MTIRSNLRDMEIGDIINCEYYAPTANKVGKFFNFGTTGATGIQTLTAIATTANGSFGFVYVGDTLTGRMLLVADRPLQATSWDLIHEAGLTGEKEYDLKIPGAKFFFRLIDGGNTALDCTNSEYNMYIMNYILGGFAAGDNAFWHWKPSTSGNSVCWCQNSGTTMSSKVTRGSSAGVGTWAAYASSTVSYHYRPVVEVELSDLYLFKDGTDVKTFIPKKHKKYMSASSVVPTLSSNSGNANFIASASTDASNAYKAFDSNSATLWESKGNSVEVSFPTSTAMTGYYLAGELAKTRFYLQGWDDSLGYWRNLSSRYNDTSILNKLDKSPYCTLTNPLKVTAAAGDIWGGIRSTKGRGYGSGKYYWEVTLVTGKYCMAGVSGRTRSMLNYPVPGTSTSSLAWYMTNGLIYPTGEATGVLGYAGDVIGFFLDLGTEYGALGSLKIYRNNVPIYAYYGLYSVIPETVYPTLWVYGSATYGLGSMTVNFGDTPFVYPHDGYVAYSSINHISVGFNAFSCSKCRIATKSTESVRITDFSCFNAGNALIPAMSSNTSVPGYTASASSDNVNAYKVFDSNDSTYWEALSDAGEDLTIELKVPVEAVNYSIDAEVINQGMSLTLQGWDKASNKWYDLTYYDYSGIPINVYSTMDIVYTGDDYLGLTSSVTAWRGAMFMQGKSYNSGKYYWEVTVLDTTMMAGIGGIGVTLSTQPNAAGQQAFVYYPAGKCTYSPPSTTGLPVAAKGDIIGFVLDTDYNGGVGRFEILQNNTVIVAFNDVKTKIPGLIYPVIYMYTASSSSIVNLGDASFKYPHADCKPFNLGVNTIEGSFENNNNYFRYRALITGTGMRVKNMGIRTMEDLYYAYGDNAITSMTGVNAAVATASNEITAPAWRAFDGIKVVSTTLTETGRWATSTLPSVATPHWLKYNFGTGKVIGKYGIFVGAVGTTTNFMAASPKDWTFEGSNDNSIWTVLDKRTEQRFAIGDIMYYEFFNTTAYQYYLIRITANNGHASSVTIGELEMFEVTTGSSMYSFDCCINGTAYASTALAGKEAAYAFDGVFTNYWCTSTSSPTNTFLAYNFPVARKISRVRLYNRVDTPAARFTSFSIQGSNNSTDGSNGSWSDLATGLTMTALAGWNEYTFGNTTAYLWVRIFQSSNPAAYINVAECEMLELLEGTNGIGYWYKLGVSDVSSQPDDRWVSDIEMVKAETINELGDSIRVYSIPSKKEIQSDYKIQLNYLCEASSGNALNAFTGNASDEWEAGSVVGEYVSYGFMANKAVTAYTFEPPTTLNKAPKAWSLLGYNGVDWTLLDSRSNVSDWVAGTTKEFVFYNITRYSKYKFVFYEVNGGSSVAIKEIGLYKKRIIYSVLGSIGAITPYKYKVDIGGVIIKNYDPVSTTLDIDTSVNIYAAMLSTDQPYTVTVTVYQDDGVYVVKTGTVTIYNTPPTVVGGVTRMRASFTIDDNEGDTIQYKVAVNGVQLYPVTVGYDTLKSSPQNIVLDLQSDHVTVGASNQITVSAKDQYGTTYVYNESFMGEYNGLMFKDTEGNLYTTDLGEIIKILDIGFLVAGQNSSSHQVLLQNKTPDVLTGVKLEKYPHTLPVGADVEISRSDAPFVSENPLFLNHTLELDEEVTFYVKLVTDRTAYGSGDFKVKATGSAV